MGKPEPFYCLFKILVGSVMAIAGPLQWMDRAYLGWGQSLVYAVVTVVAFRLLITGFFGLLEKRYSLKTTWAVTLLAALPIAWIGPGISVQHHQAYETRTWEEIAKSRDALLWQRVYTTRVPEAFRRPGWRSLYVLAVCRYSLDSQDFSTLQWYAEQAFREHPERYDDRARDALIGTVRGVFGEALNEMRRKGRGVAASMTMWTNVLRYIEERPSREIVWDLSGVPTAQRTKVQRDVCRELEKALQKEFQGPLLRFRNDVPRKEDLVWSVIRHQKGWATAVRAQDGSPPLLVLHSKASTADRFTGEMMTHLGVFPVKEEEPAFY